MPTRTLTASTAVAAALTLFAPATAQAQGQPVSDPSRLPICADGAPPTCAEGQPLTFGEAIERFQAEGDAAALAELLAGQGTAICIDGEVAVCADGSAARFEAEAPVTAGQESDAATAEPEVAEDEVIEEEIVEDAPAEAPVAEAPAEAPVEAPAEEAVTEEAPAEDAEATAEAEPAPEPEPIPQISDLPVTADEPPEQAEAPEAEAEPAPEAAAEAEADGEAPSSLVRDLARSLAGEPAADAEPDAAEAEVIEPEAAEPEVTEAAPADAGAPVVTGDSASLGDEAVRVVESLLGMGRPEAGDGGGALAALLPRDDAEAAAEVETVETEVTEADSRQSDEDFDTDPAGRPARDRGNRDIERLALLGLGALAVGAILSSGDEVVSNTGDRVVLRRGTDDFYVLRDDDAILRRPGSRVRTERFDDGSTRTFFTRDDGSIIITVRDASGRVVLREREDTDGRRVVLIDDTVTYEPVTVSTLPPPERREVTLDQDADAAAFRAALDRAMAPGLDRSFSLRQVRDIPEVRKLVPEIVTNRITFETASAAIRASEAQALANLGVVMARMIQDDPRELFLIEGHTDAVGGAAYNLALSDRRAESVALALTEYFDIPPENMVVQGYGFTDLVVATAAAEARNRRVAVRRVTPLLIERTAQR